MMRFPLNDDSQDQIEDLQHQLDVLHTLTEMIADGKVVAFRGEDGEVLFKNVEEEQNFGDVNFNN
jgi:hypothetical protein